MYLPLLLSHYDNIYRYLAFARGDVVDIQYRRGVEPTQAGELGLAPRAIARSVRYRRPVARSLHLVL